MISFRRVIKPKVPKEEPVVEIELDAETCDWHAFVHPL